MVFGATIGFRIKVLGCVIGLPKIIIGNAIT